MPPRQAILDGAHERVPDVERAGDVRRWDHHRESAAVFLFGLVGLRKRHTQLNVQDHNARPLTRKNELRTKNM